MEKSRSHCAASVLLAAISLATGASAAPFETDIPFVQPDGTAIEIRGKGDEFYAVFETLDGYTVTFDQATRAYVYAARSADGTDLVPTAWPVGQSDPAALGLEKHLRRSPETIRAQAQARVRLWEGATRNGEHWKLKKESIRAAEKAAAEGRTILSPPSSTTTGTRVGLCLLIDFPDDTNTVSQAEVIKFCNGDAYAGFGNNGSVKKYYQDNSNGLLTYTNIVTAYIRMTQPKTYYNNTSIDCGTQARLLISDAVAILKSLPNYAAEIAPAFANLTLDASSCAVACNVFYAGGNGGVWERGLWPHSYSLSSALEIVSGIHLYNYQITNIGSALSLGTFCHENGHMLCDFPDLYDYGYDSVGGAGFFCLMGYGGIGGNPVQICAYLKLAAGWATAIDVGGMSSPTATVSSAGSGFNRFYRHVKPGVPTEYYLVENRQKAGRDATLLAAGAAIWHVDELGSRDNQSLTYNSSHANYELTLVQADHLWHFENNGNLGDANDLFYRGNAASGYTNRFCDSSSPSARWWDGTSSGIYFGDFGASGTNMTFLAQIPNPIILTASPLSAGVIGRAYHQTLSAVGGIDPYAWVVTSNALPTGLTLTGNAIAGTPTAAETTMFQLQVTDAASVSTSAVFRLTVNQPRSVPFNETFENGGALPSGWDQEYVTNTLKWICQTNGYTSHPPAAHGGSYLAYFKYNSKIPRVTRLISPPLDFGASTRNAQLSFWHCMPAWGSDQDELRVYYKCSASGNWQPLAAFTTNTPSWAQHTLLLPSPSRTCWVAFEGTSKYGYGVCIDDVDVTGTTTPHAIWETNHFTEAEMEAGTIAGDSADPDGDGIANLLEYALGLDPRAADAAGLPTGGVWGHYLTLSYRQNRQATDLAYEVEACTNLPGGRWATNDVSEISRSDSNQWWQVTARHNVPVTNAPSRFLRLKVTLP